MPADVRIRQPQYSKGTISMALVHEALRSAELQGINTELLLQHAGIALELTHAPKARVAVSAYAQLWIALADQLNDEFFGMDRHPMRRGSYQLISRLVMRSDHLEQAFRQILQFLNTVLDDIHSELQLEGGKAILILHDRAEIKPMFSYATYLMLVHGLLCWLADQRLNIEKIELKCAAPVSMTKIIEYVFARRFNTMQSKIVS